MKYIILTLAAILTFTVLYAQQPSNITGTTTVASHKKIGLYKVLNGRLVEIGTSVPNTDGTFGFRFAPEYEGLYAIGVGNPLAYMNIYRFYFRGNDDLHINLSTTGYELVGKNSPENEALYRWDTLSKSIHDKSVQPGGMSTYVDFFPEIEELKGQLVDLKQDVKTGNATFDAFFPQLVDYDFAFYAINYLYMPRSAHPSPEEMSAFYTSFDADKFLQEDLLKYPYGDRFLSNLVYRKSDIASKPTFEQQVAAIPVDVLKGQFVLNRLEHVNSYADFQDMHEQFKPYFTLPEQQARVTATETKLVDTKVGTPAFNFSFPDVTGKKIGLTDLKGKLVLVDLWATWCGPCKAQEPAWEKLTAEYQGKDIAFVGVSVDQDKAAWEKYVADKNLKGLQLHAGPGNPLSAAYKVNGIPRYILIDKVGNLITPDSPRPTDPELKELIDQWLRK